MVEVALSPRAQLDLESIVLHIGLVIGQPDAARKVSDEIFGTLSKLESIPAMGEPFEHEDVSRSYRRLLAGRYCIYYELDGDGRQVVVRHIFHQSQDIDDHALVDLAQ